MSIAVNCTARFSPTRVYRYELTREWEPDLPKLAVIGLNPSTADESQDDPTIRRVTGFAERLGCGGIIMLNLGAFRATDPKDWRRAMNPIGPENTAAHLMACLRGRNILHVVAAWGSNGKYAPAQCKAVMRLMPDLMCWGLTPSGFPRHPLMLPYTAKLVKLSEAIGGKHEG